MSEATLDTYPVYGKEPTKMPVQSIVALRVFETAAEKLAAGDKGWFLMDTIFVYPSGGNKVLVSDQDTVDAVCSMSACRQAFQRAGIGLVPMRDAQGQEFLVNESFVSAVQPALILAG